MMDEFTYRINETAAAEAFTRQSSKFDELYSSDAIIQYKRARVRAHVEKYIHSNSSILELNAGTGDDAVYFAQQGHSVHATDIAEGMIGLLSEKAANNNLLDKITSELCSFTSLEDLKNKGPYDLIFSNFAGLNCTGALEKVLRSFGPLLKPGGTVTLVILPGFCLWETLLVFKGKFKTAFRRSFSRQGVSAHIEGQYFSCWYYNPSFIKHTLKEHFDILGLEGLCTIVPPSYIEQFAQKYPRLYRALKRAEDQLKSSWPWRSIGDYYIISLKKKPGH